MASAARALHVFRATTSLSSRPFARSTVGRAAVLGRRYYSEEKAEDKAEAQKEGANEGESVLTPEQEKLKAKEAEVVDLTVRELPFNVSDLSLMLI